MPFRNFLGFGRPLLLWALLVVGTAGTPLHAQTPTPEKPVSPALPVPVTQVQEEATRDKTSQETPDRRTRRKPADQPKNQLDPEIATIDADDQRREGDVFYADGLVDLRYQGARLQADHVTYNEKTGEATATGNVIYDAATDQRITAKRGTLNVRTKIGTFHDCTGYAIQDRDGTLVQFTADRVEKTGTDTYVLYNATVTSCCEDTVPLWKISARKTNLRVNRRLSATNGTFRIKEKPILYLPFISLPLDRRNRQSGFLIPTTGSNTNTGRFFRNAYYQTLGDSADILFRGDIYTARGIGFGASVRARTGEDSYIKAGSYTVIDRIFGQRADAFTANQGGTLFYAQGVQHFQKGFLAVVDVNYTTSLDFRAIFANNIEEAFNPERRSQVYLNNNFRNFSFNLLSEARTTRVTERQADGTAAVTDIGIRQLPSLNLTLLPMPVKDGLPVYVSGEVNVGAFRRKETGETGITFLTPPVVQRLDIAPVATFPIFHHGGWAVTPSLSVRSTYYSNTLNPTAAPPTGVPATNRLGVSGQSLFRNLVDFSVDIRPPALERVFFKPDGTARFKHIIEPSITYRRIAGIDDFGRTLRFDLLDTVTNTNEVEFSIANRILAPRQGGQRRRDERARQQADLEQRLPDEPGSNQSAAKPKEDEDATKKQRPVQARELLSVTLTQKYFFDPTFGGALQPGNRNQIAPLLSLSSFTSGGQIRRFSPLHVTVRTQPLSSMFADVRFDYDTRSNEVRGLGAAGTFIADKFRLQQRWYYSRQVRTKSGVVEPGTFSGNQIISSAVVGDESHGLYGGGQVSYDFSKALSATTNQFQRNGLIRSGFFLGYAFRCGSLEIDYRSVNLGVATAGRLTFSFTLRGIGTFGTDQFGGFRDR